MQVLGSHFVLIAACLLPLTLAITYTLAVSADHVYPIIPFMSYTGDLPIESCIFSLGVNLTAALFLVIVFLRYSQIKKLFEGEQGSEFQMLRKQNKRALEWGMAAVLGLSITASFQQYHAYTTHIFGACLCCYGGFAYFCYQTVLSQKLVGKVHGMGLVYFRVGLCLSSALFLLSAPLLLLYLDLIYSRSHAEAVCWSQSEAGWLIHLCSSVVEWLTFFSNEAYIISFYKEFKCIRIKRDEIVFSFASEIK